MNSGISLWSDLEEGKVTLPLIDLPIPLFGENPNLKMLYLPAAHPEINGNKWFKLKHHLLLAKAQGADTLLSFGGIHSNHLRALAKACKIYGFHCKAIERGEEPDFETPTLNALKAVGAEIQFVNRTDYRDHKEELAKAFAGENLNNTCIIEEGGFGEPALLGSSEIAQFIPEGTDEVWIPVGSGATLAGIALGLADTNTLIRGISAVKGADLLTLKILEAIAGRPHAKFEMDFSWHQGGFAKLTPTIAKFMEGWQEASQITIEHVYNAKALYGLQQTLLTNSDYQKKKIVYIHTGGIDI
jgi:1-aminocyclopropane-1-carboxylate deaminase/D-cysteine desulfhydrase-like pyridoxal-dependent ACC family enzyme